MSGFNEYVDIMAPRRAETSIFKFMTRTWEPKKTMILDKYLTPKEIKDAAECSLYLNNIIDSMSSSDGDSKDKLKKEVKQILEEMGLEKRMCVIRWMGVFFLKMSFMMKISVFVNESAVLNLRDTMGSNPLLFLPTHRSYADFCLMTYLCYHYDIDFPAVAAGMDFYSMAVVGRAMRDTGAFYMRRTLVGAPLYAATLRQYVRTLVAHHAAPIEFFIEATRSRSNKSLQPKFGMLSMSLLPFFAGEVPDISIVPVNISYDRLMEQSLFAYEHLGVPKPKESTGSFLKAIYRLNENFGNIYMSLGTPLSIKEFLRKNHNQGPFPQTQLPDVNPEHFTMVQDIGKYVVALQQKCTVHTITNLMSLVLMQSIIKNEALHYKEVLREIQYMIAVLRSLGSTVFENDIKRSMDRILVVHSKMMRFDKEERLRLISSDLMVINDDVKKKMKGHILEAETMVSAVPVIQLQLYVNPALAWLLPPALLSRLVHKGVSETEQLRADYQRLRQLFMFEFYYYDKEEPETYQKAVDFCIEHKVVTQGGRGLMPGGEEKLNYLLKWSIWPALNTMINCIEVLQEKPSWEHSEVIKSVQRVAESRRRHPYSLSLEAAGNCLQGLAGVGAINKLKRDKQTVYEVVQTTLNDYHILVKSVTPSFDVDFSRNNVILDQRVFPSRL